MRSLLAQASSIEKAVEKAWSSAGMPTEFSIKILDFGEKGFFGITKKPTIVSIFYEPKNQTSLSKSQQERPARPKRTTSRQPQQRQQQQRTTNATKPRQQQTRQPQPRQQERPVTKKSMQPRPERHFWPDPLIHDITKWLTELTKTLKITTPFKAQVNNKALVITFDGYVLNNQDEERFLFSGLSYLLIQFLKKEHKKKFQGYQLVITSKRFQK